MTFLSIILLSLSAFMTTNMEANPPEKGKIDLIVSNLRNGDGKIRVVVFNSEDGFPGKHEKGYKVLNIEATSPETVLVIDDIPYGAYAIAVLHDENDNGKMDTNMVGMPKEGYGVSNNASASMFGPPSYEDAVFQLDATTKALSISLVY
ncbi:DUF2141 domain-containing protein [Roseivirga sp. BDSF3-8]|uniref:DUF2141 domain-containing protein n=1 Tax=Roseivirga sp. BDSF3-8 TaxID=3241598 RepID=UPI003532803F